jgi:ribosomal protein S6--L-glutamate ligase
MKIAILCRNRKRYSTRRRVEAAEGRGHEVRVIDTLKCDLDIASRRPAVHYRGEELNGFDTEIPRIGASVTVSGLTHG